MPILTFPTSAPSPWTPSRHLLDTTHAELNEIAAEDLDVLEVAAEFVHGLHQRLRAEREALKRTP